jgi:hypothetical protein
VKDERGWAKVVVAGGHLGCGEAEVSCLGHSQYLSRVLTVPASSSRFELHRFQFLLRLRQVHRRSLVGAIKKNRADHV